MRKFLIFGPFQISFYETFYIFIGSVKLNFSRITTTLVEKRIFTIIEESQLGCLIYRRLNLAAVRFLLPPVFMSGQFLALRFSGIIFYQTGPATPGPDTPPVQCLKETNGFPINGCMNSVTNFDDPADSRSIQIINQIFLDFFLQKSLIFPFSQFNHIRKISSKSPVLHNCAHCSYRSLFLVSNKVLKIILNQNA